MPPFLGDETCGAERTAPRGVDPVGGGDDAPNDAANVDDAADGSTPFPGSENADDKIITGAATQRIAKMKQAFSKILQEKSMALTSIERR